MRRNFGVQMHRNLLHAIQGLYCGRQRKAQGVPLALGWVAQFDVKGNGILCNLHIAHCLGRYKISPGVGIHYLFEGI